MDALRKKLFVLLLLGQIDLYFSIPSNVPIENNRSISCNWVSYNKRSGFIMSPSYQSSNDLRKNERSEWRILADSDERISLTITKMEIEKSADCEKGYLEIRDGHRSTAPSLGKYCGNQKVEPMITQGNKMLITYYAKSHKFRGFSAHYETICGCDFYVEETTTITSPEYPNTYPPDKNCKYKIIVPEGHRVVLNFKSFDLENEPRCLYDYVQVRDGPKDDSKLIGTYCKKAPLQIISKTNFLYIQFVSDASAEGKGFLATVVNEYDECTTGKHQCSQECVNTIGSYKCLCRDGYELNPDGKTCKSKS